MRMKSRASGLLLGVLLAATLTGPASADLQVRNDPQGDVAGGRLDLRRVGLDHDATHLSMRVLTWTRWSRASLEGGGEDVDRFISWAFDSTGGPALDYGVVFDAEGGQFVAYLVRVNPGEEATRLGNIDTFRRDGKFVEVTIRRRRMDTRGAFVRWAAQTVWRNGTSCDITCFDSRPEQPDKANPTLLTHDL